MMDKVEQEIDERPLKRKGGAERGGRAPQLMIWPNSGPSLFGHLGALCEHTVYSVYDIPIQKAAAEYHSFFVFWHCSNIAAAANLVSSLVLLCMSCPTINSAIISAAVLQNAWGFFESCFLCQGRVVV